MAGSLPPFIFVYCLNMADKISINSPYYGVRRFGPYLGVIQIIDVGDACAYSTNGRSWRIRQQTGSGSFRWGATVVRDEGMGRVSLVNADHLLVALENKPNVPFPIRDVYECWLLDKETGLPLALLKTRYRESEMDSVTNPRWEPFAHTGVDFVSSSLMSKKAISRRSQSQLPHRLLLEQQINNRARPMPVAQWMKRAPNGSGVGLGGLRVDEGINGKKYLANDFPDLLVSEICSSEMVSDLVRDYHDWQAPWLLAHQDLSTRQRKHLEQAAFKNPLALLSSYPLIPDVFDEEGMQLALVSAKIMKSG
ncbi:MAG: hypothetical protein V3W04_05665 [Gammaproteobacteria bacterium]